MKRIVLYSAFCGVAAFGGAGLTGGGAGGQVALGESQEASAVARRVYEGRAPQFWGTGVSPDGRYVTQTEWESGDLAVLDLLTGDKRLVTNKGEDKWVESYAYSEMARFSPDGERIAYSWFTEPGTYELRVINTDGTGSRLVTRAQIIPERNNIEWWPDLHGWTPDGERLVATFYYSRADVVLDQPEISLVSLTDGSRRVLHTPEPGKAPWFAALSPDGRFLGFDENRIAGESVERRSADVDVDVFVKPVDGGAAVQVAGGPSTDLFLGWTPAGDVIFYSDRDLTEGVWRIPMRDGRPAGEAVRLVGDLWGMQPLGVAGDDLLYGVQTQELRLNVVQLDLERNMLVSPANPVEPAMRRSTFPAWSPDGRQLLYWVSERERGGQTVHRVMLRSATSGETRDVTPDDTEFRSAVPLTWRRDGHEVMVQVRRRGERDLVAFSLETRKSRSVFSSGADAPGLTVLHYAVSSDWRILYLLVRDSHKSVSILRHDIETGTQDTLLTRPPRDDALSNSLPIVLSPDGRWLAFYELGHDAYATSTLKLLPTTGGDARPIYTHRVDRDSRLPRCYGSLVPLWTRDGQHILTTLHPGVRQGDPMPSDACKLHKIPVEGGDPIFVGGIPQHTRLWALSADDTRLAIEMGQPRGEIWVVQGLSSRH